MKFIFLLLAFSGCVDNNTTPVDCGPLPHAPYLEFNVVVEDGEVLACMDVSLGYEQMNWGYAVLEWEKCMTGRITEP